MLYTWKEFGLFDAHQKRIQKYVERLKQENKEISDKEIAEIEFPFFEDVLRGKINFLRMVKGKDDSLYRKYLKWYRELSLR